jgi:UDPglucose 6-dehydrogenase
MGWWQTALFTALGGSSFWQRIETFSAEIMGTLLREQKILKGRTIASLGFAFKPNTDDLRDIPPLDIARQLISLGALVVATDPVAVVNARRFYLAFSVIYCDEPLEALQDADAIILFTEWPDYRTFI